MTALDDARRQAEEALAKWDHDPDFMADNCIQPLRALIAAAQRAEAALALIASRDCCCPAWLDQPCDGCRARAALAGGAAPPPRLPQPERGGGMRLRIPIRQGERYPRGYGFVWIDFVRNEAVCYPIPLNIVLRLVYVLWIWCLMPFRVTEYERLRSRVAALEDEVLSLIKRKDDWIGRYDRLRKFVGDPERGARP